MPSYASDITCAGFEQQAKRRSKRYLGFLVHEE